MLNFPFVDLGIAAVVIWAVISGMRRGFMKSLLNLGSFILALLLTYFLTNGIMILAGNWLGMKTGVLAIFNAIFTLVIMIILFTLFEITFNYIEGHIIRNRPSGGTEAVSRILGISIGFVKAILLVAVVFMLMALMFPNESFVISQIETSIAGQFLFEKNPLLFLISP